MQAAQRVVQLLESGTEGGAVGSAVGGPLGGVRRGVWRACFTLRLTSCTAVPSLRTQTWCSPAAAAVTEKWPTACLFSKSTCPEGARTCVLLWSSAPDDVQSPVSRLLTGIVSEMQRS